MKTVLVIAMISSIAAAAHAQTADRQPPSAGVSAPPSGGAPSSAVGVSAPPSGGAPSSADAPPSGVAPSSHEADTDESPRRPVGKRFVNGFRLGWMYVGNIDKVQQDSGMSLRDRLDLKSPHMFLIGYELMFRAIGHAGLNAIVVGNASVAGIDQAKFIPSANGLVGVEVNHDFQAAVGISLTPDQYAPSHMIVAAGWTPAFGSLQTPVHILYIPDPDGNYRLGATLGMNW